MNDLARVLSEVVEFVHGYVVLSDVQADTIALWICHSHGIDAADTTPYIAVTSAEKRSGKTRLLEAVELLVHEPLPTANISDAALFRAIAELSPTILMDEVDAVFGPKARDREDLRGMLNAGYRRGAVTRRMGGARMTTLEAFPVYCAKMFAGIGELPDTLSDRSIRIRLERRTREEPVERFRRRDVLEIAEPIHISVLSLMAHHLETLRYARPQLPDELDDGQQDCWEPWMPPPAHRGRPRVFCGLTCTQRARTEAALRGWSARVRGRLSFDLSSTPADLPGDPPPSYGPASPAGCASTL